MVMLGTPENKTRIWVDGTPSPPETPGAAEVFGKIDIKLITVVDAWRGGLSPFV